MDKQDIQNISVKIAGRDYPMQANPEEIAIVREIESKLHQEIEDLHKRYANSLNKQDILSILLFNYAKNVRELEQKDSGNSIDLLRKVEKIDVLLSEALQSS